ncbi:MAG: EamA family transporter [Deltaproteobacteria bacterium]|nr:EamA family transporter [Deltaproteobacteria bacterium]
MGEKRSFSLTDFYLILAMVIWGSDYYFAKVALREISPLSFAAMRTLIATTVLFPLLLRREKNWHVSRRTLLGLAVLALFGTVLNRIFWSAGLDLTTASNSALIMSASPIFVLFFSFLFLRTEITFRAGLGIIISFVGVFLVIERDWAGWTMTSQTFLGDLLTIGAALSFALFTIFAKRMLQGHSSLKVTAYIVLIGAIFLAPFLPNEKGGGWGGISGWAWVAVVYVGIMGNCLAYFLWVRGIKNIGALRTVLYQYLNPVTAILFAVPLLHESLTGTQIIGAIVVFGGIFLARSE